MKLYRKIGWSAAALLLMCAAQSCGDDTVATPLPDTTVTTDNASWNSLTFQWDKVEGAVQYSLQLVETETGDIISTSVQNTTSATFTGLKPLTDYTLTVYAYAAMGSDQTTSEPQILTARTADYSPVAAPQVQYERQLNTLVFNWPAVESATSYVWTFTDSEGNVIGSDNSAVRQATFSGLQTDVYTFTIYADSDEPGFKTGPTATVTVDFVREREQVWTTDVTYTNAITGGRYDVKLIAYDDNSYTLASWCGVEGYDLEFTIDETDPSDMFKLSSDLYAYNSANQSYAVPTGLTSPATISLVPGNNLCNLGGAAGKGTLMLCFVDGNSTIENKVSWGEEQITIDDIIGTWTATINYDYYGEPDPTVVRTVEFVKTSENSFSVEGPVYSGYNIEFVVNFDDMTFTVNPTEAPYSMVFASDEDPDKAITGYINAKSFTFTRWALWWSGELCVDNGVITYTRDE